MQASVLTNHISEQRDSSHQKSKVLVKHHIKIHIHNYPTVAVDYASHDKSGW